LEKQLGGGLASVLINQGDNIVEVSNKEAIEEAYHKKNRKKFM